MKLTKKKHAEEHHFINRFKERVGITLTHEEYMDLSNKAGDRKYSTFKGYNRSGTNQIVEMTYSNFKFKAVYDPIRNRLVTIFGRGIVYDENLVKVEDFIP